MLSWTNRTVQRFGAYLSAEASPSSTGWMILVALASTAILLLSMNMQFGIYDEPIMMQGAVEVGRGQVPHRDFFWVYGPMPLWIVSALFSTFGESIMVVRLHDIAFRGAVILVCGLIARRLGLRTSFIAGVMLVETILLFGAGFPLYHVFSSMLCALVGTLLLVADRPGADARTGRLLAAGALTGLTALIRYDIGFFVLVAHVASLGLFCLNARRKLRVLIGQVLAYGIGVSLVFLPVAAAAWMTDAIPGFMHDIVTFPSANYARMRSLPWPVPGLSVWSLPPLVSYLPFLVVALGIAWFVRARMWTREQTNLNGAAKLAIALLLLVAAFTLKGMVRVSLMHSVLALVPAVLLLAFLFGRKDVGIALPSLAIFGLAATLITLNALLTVRTEATLGFSNLLPARMVDDASPTTPGCTAPPTIGPGIVDDDTYRAACFIAARTRPGEYIFVGAGRHDKLFVGNVALYYISGRRPGTHWYHMEPGLQTQLEIQQSIIGDLTRNDVRLIALDTRADDAAEPNDSALSSGMRLLDRFIADRYIEVARFGTIRILARRQDRLVAAALSAFMGA